MDEVEDIMCDQCIITPEFKVEFDKKSYLIVPAAKLWLAVDLVARALVPSVINFCYTAIRNQQNVVYSVRYTVFPALAAFLANSLARSLASVQRISLRYPPICEPGMNTTNDGSNKTDLEEVVTDQTPEKCVECVVLSEPDHQDATVDVVFIHGLHGGLDKTWRQGTWRTRTHRLREQRPVRRQSSGNMYVPRSQSSMKRTLSDIYSKIPNKVARKDQKNVGENNTIVTSEPISDIDECNVEETRILENETDEDTKDYTMCWPKDWLPKDCPNARVIALNYSTDLLWYPLWQKKRARTDLVQRSKEMIEELLRLGIGSKPIVWVGHSKGGLYIKQILINAFEGLTQNVKLNNVFNQTKAIMFYSVPHKGSSLADFTFPLFKRSVELLEIQRNCDFVLDLHKKFLSIFDNNNVKPEIFSFIETSFTLMGFMYMKIISYDSADPNIGIKCDVPLDHREICKPAGRDCFLYVELVKLIKKCLNDNKYFTC